MKVVKFIKGMAPYNSGEIAGFEENIADQLIAKQIAVPYNAASGAKESSGIEPELQALGGGWYQLPDGSKVRGLDEARAALQEMRAGQAKDTERSSGVPAPGTTAEADDKEDPGQEPAEDEEVANHEDAES